MSGNYCASAAIFDVEAIRMINRSLLQHDDVDGMTHHSQQDRPQFPTMRYRVISGPNAVGGGHANLELAPSIAH